METAPSSIVIEGLLYGSLFGGRGENTKILFRTDVVASVCHVIVFTDDLGSNRLLMFGIYRKSTGAVPPRDFTLRLYESGATVQGCPAFEAGQVATLDFGNP